MSEVGTSSLKVVPVPAVVAIEKRLTTGQWGVITFLCSEVAFFSTLIVAYVVFYGRDHQPGGLGGPTPASALSLSLVIGTTLCLLASSVTIHLADRALRNGLRSSFLWLWAGTIVLGIAFLLGTAHEWNELIHRHHLTISRNLFGTSFYTLVGFHALHVTIGVLLMAIVLALALKGHLTDKNHESVQLISWYWHFVDAVWIVVFSVVYLMPHLK
ncbi:MAG: cytochrome c oxidase subunit 3 [Planctomycetes bacterium]|nr:cytochrome c oxidase subunit 3 [Planctomycetota bacterium]